MPRSRRGACPTRPRGVRRGLVGDLPRAVHAPEVSRSTQAGSPPASKPRRTEAMSSAWIPETIVGTTVRSGSLAYSSNWFPMSSCSSVPSSVGQKIHASSWNARRALSASQSLNVSTNRGRRWRSRHSRGRRGSTDRDIHRIRPFSQCRFRSDSWRRSARRGVRRWGGVAQHRWDPSADALAGTAWLPWACRGNRRASRQCETSLVCTGELVCWPSPRRVKQSAARKSCSRRWLKGARPREPLSAQ